MLVKMGSSSPDRAENTKIFENHHPEKNIPTFLLLPDTVI